MNGVTSMAETFSVLLYLPLAIAMFCGFKSMTSLADVFNLKKYESIPFSDPRLKEFFKEAERNGFKSPRYWVYASMWFIGLVASLGVFCFTKLS